MTAFALAPPSYEEAVVSRHLTWPSLVAPYVPATDYPSLCLVCRRFNDVFTPLLWRDPLVTIRKLGLDPADDFTWYFKFIHKRAPTTKYSTRAHVLSLDFRQMARVSYHYRGESAITSTFRFVPTLFPNLRCVLLDGDAESDAHALQSTPWHALGDGGLEVLSLSGCQFLLGSTFFEGSEGLRALVCLDVSGLPGSIRPLIGAAAGLPRLRILKARGRELGAGDAVDLAKAFAGMLWSLDLGDNPLPDAVLPHLRELMMHSPSLRTAAHVEVEGRVEWMSQRGTSQFGPFYHVVESSQSGTFSHPARYLADSPSYHGDQEGAAPVRGDGRAAIKSDSVDVVKQAVTADPEASPSVAEAVLLAAHSNAASLCLTHLRLSNTKVTAPGVEALIRMSPGQLEIVDCDSMRIPLKLSWPRPWPKSTRLYGMLGSSHIWRPVFSSNLRALRIHHSVVTQIPTLEAEGLSALNRIWLAETAVREKCEMAYPQAFVPDMNPRITSITLTKIPRRSSGPLIEKITNFIELASIQERDIADATISSSRRAPMMLRGLRHISLEFEADPMEDLSQLSLSGDLDVEGLLDMDRESFTFFDEGPSGRDARSREQRASPQDPNPIDNSRFKASEGVVLEGECIVHTDKWLGNVFRARVWVGTGVPGPHPAVNAYMDLVRSADLRKVIGVASPSQVRAGVPTGSLLFLDAWEAIVVPAVMREPGRGVLEGMRDVVAELKRYRVATRQAFAAEERRVGKGRVRRGAPHYFYTGAVEVVAVDSANRGSEYWR
ncbi:uncharacterized protein DNG_06953 [Cephalotrichum gorgonifer]|uniref:Uncharacterized protein n=1 Tax=Cephalotrichum gorgonifer TaxID=2041049 RepID=A0AAE8N3R0_9PEZI|nr:uncharacterized protein DNG_06953 [Cephalotrichum gorgonifer]